MHAALLEMELSAVLVSLQMTSEVRTYVCVLMAMCAVFSHGVYACWVGTYVPPFDLPWTWTHLCLPTTVFN